MHVTSPPEGLPPGQALSSSAAPGKGRRPLTETQQQLAEKYLPMARSMAKPLKAAWPVASDEFESAACYALVEAAEAFDPGRNVKFSTFARYRIQGALRDEQRRLLMYGWRTNTQNAPTLVRLAPDIEKYGRVLLSEPDPPVDEALEAVEEVERWLRKLPPRHSAACRQIYLHGKNQGEAAAHLGCSKSRLSYLHKESLEMLNGSWDARNCDPQPSRDLASECLDPSPTTYPSIAS